MGIVYIGYVVIIPAPHMFVHFKLIFSLTPGAKTDDFQCTTYCFVFGIVSIDIVSVGIVSVDIVSVGRYLYWSLSLSFAFSVDRYLCRSLSLSVAVRSAPYLSYMDPVTCNLTSVSNFSRNILSSQYV
jgi:hypothetical protein